MADPGAGPPPISIQTVQMPQVGGGVEGLGAHFQSGDNTGQLTFGVPLRCSPCRGVEPRLELTYGSFGGNGVFGQGFEIELASICRQTSQRVPRYDDSDVFLLSGAPLTLALGDATEREIGGTAYAITPFRPRVESRFDRVERWSSGPLDVFWRVLHRDGSIAVYGRSAAARVADPSDPTRIAEWLVEYEFHPRGDVLAYSYKREDDAGVAPALYELNRVRVANLYPERIRYGNDTPYAASDGGVTPPPDQTWHFEVVFDYGEYDIEPANDDPYTPVRSWASRPDPFSAYKSGFERRTHRLCRNALMFHRFEDELGPEPVLVHALALVYDEDTSGASLASCGLVGYRHYPAQPAGQRYATRGTPSLEFAWTAFDPASNAVPEPLIDTAGDPVQGFDSATSYAVADLYGDGVPGILYADGESVYYRAPVLAGAAASWTPRVALAEFPAGRTASGDGVALMDLDGDGTLDLLRIADGLDGFHRSRGRAGWGPFVSFAGGFADYWDPVYTRADLEGNGRADAVSKAPDSVGYFPNLGEQGFGPEMRAAATPGMPPTLTGEGDGRQLLTFADPLGGGVPSLVRMTDGSVECWPSLGHGRFAPVVRMDGVPRLGDDFDPARVHLADVDGSGAAALVYAYVDRVELFRNLGGNSFAALPVTVKLPAGYSRPEQIRFEDLLGNGYQCLVFATEDPAPQLWCIDLCGGTKPYLLSSFDNGQGKRTRADYRSSAHYMLLDRSDGLEWVTRLPFPIQVVARVVSDDAASGVRTAVSYRYHHGHYDDTEREFRGFGMVEHTDVEVDSLAGGAAASHTIPLLTKRWFHTGVWAAEAALERAYATEYYSGDPKAWPALESVLDLDAQPHVNTSRQAAVALSGRLLREERYGLDGSDAAAVPYDVAQQSYRVVLLQPATGDDYGAFFAHEEEAVEAHYERDPADPLVHQHFVFALDAYGDVTLESSVACPRRPAAPDPAGGQSSARIVATERAWIALTGDPDTWLLGEPASHKASEVHGAAAPDVKGLYYSRVALLAQVTAALGGSGPPTATPVDWYRYVYEDDAVSGAPITPQALLLRREEAVFTDALVTQLFAGQTLDGSLATFLQNQGGYRLDADGFWWNPSAADQYGGADAFYQPTSTTDAIATAGGPASGTVVDYTYDSHGLLLTGTAMRTSGGDVLPSAITATLLDYVALAACRIRDENGTVHEAVRDPLGLVVAVSSYGSEWGGEGERQVGFAPLDMDAPPTVPPSIDALVAAPAAYIAGAASYVYVDLDAWRAGRGPTAVAELTASAYPQGQVPGGEVQIAVTHQDGSRRVLQRARLAEPSAETTTRWRVSARVRYDAKGLAFAEWEPFFAQTCAFVQDAELTGRPAFSATYYDALDRMVRVETPKGSFSDAFFATRAYAAWSTTTADQNDTVKDSRYYGYYVTEGHPGLGRWDIDALEKAAAHYGTPNTVGHDNLGHPSALRRLLTAGGSPLVETSACDTEGNELWAADPRLGAAGVRNIERTYTLTNQVVCLSSVDAGTRWVLRDAVGNPIYQYDSRGFAMVSQYDGRQRLIAVHVTGGDGAAALDTIVELRIYGDSLDSNRNPPLADPASRNLVGREWHGYDSAGLTEHASFSLSGQPLATTSWTRSAYNQEADWALPSAPDWATRTQALAAALDTAEPQAQSWTYDALGRALERVDAAGNVRTATFHVSGLLDTIGWTVSGGSARPYVTGTSYTAHERPLTVTLANVSGTPVIATTYSYDPMTYRVSGVTAARLADAAVLQQLTYHFDPVGNLTHVENGVTLAPGSPPGDGDHTFDALYRLIASSGRVMDGYTQMVERGAGYEPFFRGDGPPGAETYSAIYSYDDGDNLTDATYTAPSSSWTTKLAVSPASNRAVPAEGRVEPDPAVGIFDGNGNLTALDGVDSIEWSYANQVRRVVAGAQTQYSLYDTRGNRVARIVESNDSQVVQKTVYVGALERCSRISGGVVVEQVDRARIVSSGPATVGVLETWSVGAAPTGATTAWFQLSDLVDSAVVEVGDEGDVRHHEEYLPYGGTALAWSPHGEADMALKIRRHGARERDATSGLYDYGWRQYACWLGRWTSPDPTFDADGLNLYAFAQCNPVTMTDRFGLGRDNKAKVRRKTFQNVRHVHERRVQSSRFRFFRRVQRAYGGTRNIAMIKLVKGSGKGRKVLYLLARSMGIGVHKLTLGGEEVITAAGSLMKRSHSEAVLRAALEVGTVKVGTKKFNLGGFSPVYAASTNEGCGAAHENCSEQSVPYLAPRFIFANKYQESAQAAGFEKLNNQHERDVANLSDYGSDAESESEYETAVADEDQFVGLDLSSGTLPAITATSMKDFLEEGPKQRKSKIRPLKS